LKMSTSIQMDTIQRPSAIKLDDFASTNGTSGTEITIDQCTAEEVEQLSIGVVKPKPLGSNQHCASLIMMLMSLVLFIVATEGTQWVRATGGNAAGRPTCRFGLWETCNCIRVGQNNDELPCRKMNRRLDTAFEEDDFVYNDWDDSYYMTRGLAVSTSVFTAFTLAFSTWEKSDTSIKPKPVSFYRVKLVVMMMFACAMLGVATTRQWVTNQRLAEGVIEEQWAWGRDFQLFRAGWITLLVACPIAQFLE
jgi:hypothetical protein